MAVASGPESRMIATAPAPGAVAGATIVSRIYMLGAHPPPVRGSTRVDGLVAIEHQLAMMPRCVFRASERMRRAICLRVRRRNVTEYSGCPCGGGLRAPCAPRAEPGRRGPGRDSPASPQFAHDRERAIHR